MPSFLRKVLTEQYRHSSTELQQHLDWDHRIWHGKFHENHYHYWRFRTGRDCSKPAQLCAPTSHVHTPLFKKQMKIHRVVRFSKKKYIYIVTQYKDLPKWMAQFKSIYWSIVINTAFNLHHLKKIISVVWCFSQSSIFFFF